MHQYLNSRGPRIRREKERVWENFWRDCSWKFPQHGKGDSQLSPRGTKGPIEDKTKEKHAKTHTNQTTTPRHIRIKLPKINTKNIKSNKGEATSNIQGKPLCWSLSRNYRLEGNGRIYLKYWKGKIYSHDYCTQKGSHSELMEQ